MTQIQRKIFPILTCWEPEPAFSPPSDWWISVAEEGGPAAEEEGASQWTGRTWTWPSVPAGSWPAVPGCCAAPGRPSPGWWAGPSAAGSGSRPRDPCGWCGWSWRERWSSWISCPGYWNREKLNTWSLETLRTFMWSVEVCVWRHLMNIKIQTIIALYNIHCTCTVHKSLMKKKYKQSLHCSLYTHTVFKCLMIIKI